MWENTPADEVVKKTNRQIRTHFLKTPGRDQMKEKHKIKSMLLALLLSLAMVVTYLPASMIAYAGTEGGDDTAAEEPVKASAKAASDGSTVLAFTSDTHNKSGNAAANRLGTWIDKVESKMGGKILESYTEKRARKEIYI